MVQKYITLNAFKEEPTIIHAVQGESESRTLYIALADSAGNPVNLTGKAVRFYAEKPDKTVVFADCIIEDAAAGKVSVALSYQAVAMKGTVNCTIYVNTSGNEALKFTNLKIVVESSNVEMYVESSSEFSALVEALSQVQDIDSRVPKTTTIAGVDLQDNITLSDLSSAGVLKSVNLLHNWYFPVPVNQKGVSGTISTAGYFIDRWILTSGSVTLTSNGLTLNGTMTQILEYAVGTDVTSSTSMYSGTATAAYNNSTKTFTITSSGGTIQAAKLEKGTVSTLPNDAPPDFGQQINLCLRHQIKLGGTFRYRAVQIAANLVDFVITTPVPLRINPAFSASALTIYSSIAGGTPESGFTFVAQDANASLNGFVIRATKTAHGLTDAMLSIAANTIFDANL